jgi:hypothetical protein
MAFASSPFRWLPIGLRTLAILIAVAAVIDPAVTSSRRGRPLLSVVATDSIRDRALFADVTRALRDDYSIAGAIVGASGTVLVGDRRPDDIGQPPHPSWSSPRRQAALRFRYGNCRRRPGRHSNRA